MKRVKILVLVVCTLFYGLSEQCSSFDEYVEKYGKVYKDEPERDQRRKIYCQNLIFMEQLRKQQPNCTFQVNGFTDQTQQQMQTNGLQTITQTIRQSTPTIEISEYPPSLDWRDRDAVTPVKDQGKCGSCWSFAGVAFAQSLLLVHNKKSLEELDLSEQYLLECTFRSTCNGGYMEYTMDKIANDGIPTEQEYPYQPYNSYQGICSATGEDFYQKNFDYYNLNDQQIITLLQQNPLAISIATENWSSYSSGVLSCSPFAGITHAVLLVGYTPDYWIVKNQWGTSWGERGYIRITRKSFNNCGIGSGVHVISIHEPMLTFFMAIWALILIINI